MIPVGQYSCENVLTFSSLLGKYVLKSQGNTSSHSPELLKCKRKICWHGCGAIAVLSTPGESVNWFIIL